MEKFRASGSTIEKLKVVKETEKQIVYVGWNDNEFREAKHSNYSVWFDSFEDAKTYLINKFNSLIKNTELKLALQKESLKKVSNLTE